MSSFEDFDAMIARAYANIEAKYKPLWVTRHPMMRIVDPVPQPSITYRRPPSLFERLEAYAQELLDEQVKAGGQKNEESLQAIRDSIQSEIVRLGQVAAMLDRHMFRLDTLDTFHSTWADRGIRTVSICRWSK